MGRANNYGSLCKLDSPPLSKKSRSPKYDLSDISSDELSSEEEQEAEDEEEKEDEIEQVSIAAF